MYILQNAMQNLLRNRGRNLMVAIIIFLIIVSTVTALMINNTAESVIEDYKARFGAEVFLTPDHQKLMEQAQTTQTTGGMVTRAISRPNLDPELLIAFGTSEYLQDKVYTASVPGSSDLLKAIDAEKGGGGMRMLSGPNAPTEEEQGTGYMNRLMAGSYDDFNDGLRWIEQGRMPSADNECIVSTELLTRSGLSVGDTFTFNSELMDMKDGPGTEEFTDISYELTIVGSYADMTDAYQSEMMQNAFTNRRNEILTTFDTITSKMVEGLNGISVDAKFYLKNPGMLDAFRDELIAKGLPDVFTVTTDEASYKRVVAPVEGLKGISVGFVILVLVFGGFIIILLSSIAIRERKYEIGVLRAMGMKKFKVALGLWSETLMITLTCLVLGLGIGLLAAQPITNVMLAQQVEAIEQTEEAEGANGFQMAGPGGGNIVRMGGGPMGGMGGSNAQPLKDLTISLDIITLLQIAGIALLLTSLAGVVAVSKITKYEPIKILMERN